MLYCGWLLPLLCSVSKVVCFSACFILIAYVKVAGFGPSGLGIAQESGGSSGRSAVTSSCPIFFFCLQSKHLCTILTGSKTCGKKQLAQYICVGIDFFYNTGPGSGGVSLLRHIKSFLLFQLSPYKSIQRLCSHFQALFSVPQKSAKKFLQDM